MSSAYFPASAGRQPVLTGLRSISDDDLYVRLAVHICGFPPSQPEEDYVYRCDVWEVVHKQLRAEIARRRIPPPHWWPKSAVPQRQRRKPNPGVIFTYGSILILAVIAGTRLL